MVTHDPKTALYADLTLHLEKGQLMEAGALTEQAPTSASEEILS
jgi:ABC-type lipoprotein export system ATPase subunit